MTPDEAKKRLRICPVCGPVRYTEYPLGKICIECINDADDTARVTDPYVPGLEKLYEKKQEVDRMYDAYKLAELSYKKERHEFIRKTRV